MRSSFQQATAALEQEQGGLSHWWPDGKSSTALLSSFHLNSTTSKGSSKHMNKALHHGRHRARDRQKELFSLGFYSPTVLSAEMRLWMEPLYSEVFTWINDEWIKKNAAKGALINVSRLATWKFITCRHDGWDEVPFHTEIITTHWFPQFYTTFMFNLPVYHSVKSLLSWQDGHNQSNIHPSFCVRRLEENQEVSHKFKRILICSCLKVTFEVTLNGWTREMWSERTDGVTSVHLSTCQQAQLLSALIRWKYSSIQLISGFREHPGRAAWVEIHFPDLQRQT